MRINLLLGFIILLGLSACKNTPQTDKPADTTTDTHSPSSKPTQKEAEKPIMGGPANFTLELLDKKSTGQAKMIAFFLDQSYVIDTATMVDGKVTFKKEEGYPQGFYYIVMPGGEDFFQIILNEDQEFTVKFDTRDKVNSVQISGSKELELMYKTATYEEEINQKVTPLIDIIKSADKNSEKYKKAKKEKQKIDKERLAYIAKLKKDHPNSLFANFKYSGQNPILDESLDQAAQVVKYRREFWDNVDFNDKRLLFTPMILNKLKRYFDELNPKRADTIISSADLLIHKVEDKPAYFLGFANWIVRHFEPTKTDLMDSEAVFTHMIQNYFTFDKAFWADSVTVYALQRRAHEMAQSLMGHPAPDVIAKDQYGKPQRLLDKKAPYLIVYMFNPECEHCAKETPLLIDYYNKNKGLIDVYAIAVETTDKKWKDYIKKTGMPFTSVFDPTNKAIYAKYFVDITPEIYLIGPDRKIIAKNLKVFQIQTMIDKDKEKRKK